MITRTLTMAIIILMIFAPATLFSNSGSPPFDKLTSVFDEMEREGILELTLEADISYLLDHRRTEAYKPAVLKYEVLGKGTVTRAAKVRLRGRYRRRVCSFPPLKLKFSEDELRKSELDPVFRSLKLVTHCLDEKFDGNENVLKEYLAYKLYSLHTNEAFRVQMVKITYRDTKDERLKMKRYGFIIEDPDELAYRLGGKECEEACLNPDFERIVQANASVLNMFQFMIGNEDWDVKMMRNLKLIELDDSDEVLLIPYDFDFSGLVNASYAVPSVDDGLRNVRDRIYLGVPVNDEVLRWAIQLFKLKKEEVLEVVRNFRLLSHSSRQEVSEYLMMFYDFLDEQDSSQVDNLYRRINGQKLRFNAALPEEAASDM